MTAETTLETVLRELRRQKDLAEKAMGQVDDRAFFASASESDNSIAILVKHMAGNMRSRWRDFLTTDGEKPDRHRDSEFALTGEDTRAALTRRWQEGWQLLFDAVAPLGLEDLARTVTIRGEAFTVLQALLRQLTHYSYHVGQIVLLAKQHAGDGWRSLSIPRGESGRFAAERGSYLGRAVASDRPAT